MHILTTHHKKCHPIKRIALPLFFCLNLALSTQTLANTNQQQSPEKSTAPATEKSTIPLSELRTLAEVLEQIKNTYVEDIDDKTLLESAIKGMLYELDPHSAYLKPTEFDDLKVSTSGEFGGLGIEIGLEEGFIKVISPIDDTPAYKAGIQAGDLIVRINDTSVKGMSLNESVELMRGKIGSPITLTVARPNETKQLTFTLNRAKIKVQSVKRKIIDADYGYLRITQFQSNTGEDTKLHLKKLLDKNKNLKGLILDLRNNPGGTLNDAIKVSDLFLDNGLIVYTEGRHPDSKSTHIATPGDSLGGAPIVVLVNGGSASASEIVAGALQDHKRGIIMGTNTFGKGSVQTILPLFHGSALKLTTARYFTPSGNSIQAQGIKPDILVEQGKLTKVKAHYENFKEADLKGHLGNDNGKKERKGDDRNDESLADKDYQLYQAVSLLKGITIANSINIDEVKTAQASQK